MQHKRIIRPLPLLASALGRKYGVGYEQEAAQSARTEKQFSSRVCL